MSEVIVFLGPSLSQERARHILPARYRPPAAQGDVYRAGLEQPKAIALIDGHFNSVPAVWHKEILWAIKQGIPVLGGASMGALRAAELHAFGMVGVGSVFESFASGELEDDDEVAISHASAEFGYRPMSDAMVNIRATLTAAHAAGIIGRATMQGLVQLAKTLFYEERSYPALFRLAREAEVDRAELGRLESWLPTGRVELKTLDATAVLERTAQLIANPSLGGQAPRFDFSHTEAWHQVRRANQSLSNADGVHLLRLELEDELIVAGEWREFRAAALARALASGTPTGDIQVSAAALDETVLAFRRERSLETENAFEAWIAAERLTEAALLEFFRHEAKLGIARTRADFELGDHLVNELRARGRYRALLERATEKSRLLSALLVEPEATVTDSVLFRWFFWERSRLPVPADLAKFAHVELGTDIDRLRRAVSRERAYSTHVDSAFSGAVTPMS